MANDPARQQAEQAIAPILAEIQRQQEEERKRASGAQATATATAQGLADVQAGIAPAIQADYQKAADSTFEYGRQLGAMFASGSEADAAKATAIVNQIGTGTQTVQGAGGAGGVIAGLNGLIPATGLQREGAAFTAAARQLPATALGRGQEQSAQIGRDSAATIAQLMATRRQEKAKLPALTNDIRAQQAEQATKDRAARLNEAIAVESLGIKRGQLAVNQQSANTSAGRLKLAVQKERFDQGLGRAKLDLDVDQYELAFKREQRLSKPKAKGGFTAKQKQGMAQLAFDTARDDFRGFEDDDGNVVPARPPVETLRDLIAADIPFSIAIKAIQRFARGRKPADVDTRTWALWRATLKWTRK